MARRKVATVRATGRWYHKFHGTYWCVVVLIFKDAEQAKAALPRLPGFNVADKYPEGLVITAQEKSTRALLRTLKRYRVGDKTHPIDGLPFSIDYGPDFDLEVPIAMAPVATPATVE
jgi:hypothetical protein